MNLEAAAACDSTSFSRHFEGSTSSSFVSIQLLSFSEAALTVDQRSVLHFAAESGSAVATAVLLGNAAREFGATVVSDRGACNAVRMIWMFMAQRLKIVFST